MAFSEHLLKWKKISETKKWPWKWQFLVMSHKITFWVDLQTYLEPKFEVPSFKNEEVIWFLVNASSNLKIQKMVSEIREIQMKPSTDFFKIHLQLFFYVCSVIFHWKIQSDPPKNLVAALDSVRRARNSMRLLVELYAAINFVANVVFCCSSL